MRAQVRPRSSQVPEPDRRDFCAVGLDELHRAGTLTDRAPLWRCRRRAANQGRQRSSLFANARLPVRIDRSRSAWQARRTRSPAHARSRRAAPAPVRAAHACPAPSSGWSRRARRAWRRIRCCVSRARRRRSRTAGSAAALAPARREPASPARAETPARPAIRRSVRPLSAASAACSTSTGRHHRRCALRPD